MASSRNGDISQGTEEVRLSRADKKSLLIFLLDEEMREYEQLGVLMALYILPYVCKEARRTSKQTGAEEESGDSEEDLVGATIGGSVGMTTDLEGITLTTNTPPSGSASIGKRKRGEGLESSKNKKISSLKVIADAISMIAVASKDSAYALKKISTNDAPVSKVVAELLTIPEIANDNDFCLRCCNMMMHQIARDMFVGMKGNKCALLDWLREHAYNSPHLQKAPNH